MHYDRSGTTSPHDFQQIRALRCGTASQPASRLFERTLEPLEDLLISPPRLRERESGEGGGRTAVSTLFLQASKLDPCRLRTLDV